MLKQNKNTFDSQIVNTLIGEDSDVKGTIFTQRSLRIEGHFEGKISSQGEVYIGEKSKVEASIFGKQVIVAGEVIGNIEVSGSLHIKSSGKVYGDISGEQLTIDEGAVYKGKVNMDIISTKSPYEDDVKVTTSA